MRDLAIPLATCVLLALIAAVWMRTKTRWLGRSRPRPDLNHFVGHFQTMGVSADVPTAVYQYLSGLPWLRGFPIHPEDKLVDVCRIAGQELNDAYASILRNTGRQLPDSRREDAFTVETVEEMVKFVAELPINRDKAGQ